MVEALMALLGAMILATWADLRAQIHDVRRRLDDHLDEPYHGAERRKAHV